MAYAVLAVLIAYGGCFSSDALRQRWRRGGQSEGGQLLAVNVSTLLSIETRVMEAQTQLTHRASVQAHLATQVEAVSAGRLAAHMRAGRLAMWDPEDADAVHGVYIVMYHDLCAKDGGVDTHVLEVERELKEQGTPLHHFDAALHGFVGKLSLTQLEYLLEDECVKSVEQDYRVHLDPKVEVEPSREAFQDGVIWGLDQLDGTVDGRYEYLNNGSGVYIYVLDTGIQTSHSEFQEGGISRAVAGADFVDLSEGSNADDILGNSCKDKDDGACSSPGAPGCSCGVIPAGMPRCSGHGTHCAGTAAGKVMGVAKGATVVAVRVLNCAGGGTNAGVLAGMDYVIRMKRDQHPSVPTVMSMSLGGARSSESYSDPSRDPKHPAVASAKALGVTVVVAAGNSGVDADTRSPAHIDDAVTVAASNINRERAYFSCFGRGVDLFAPGFAINSAVTGSDDAFEEYSGTSMATPHVAGVVALMLQHNPDWTVEQQVSELLNDCVETGSVEMLRDSVSAQGDYCSPSELDDRCKVEDNPGNCHKCNNQNKCWSKDNYELGSGEGDTPCGNYISPSGGCSGSCTCYCGGKHCDATFMFGIWSRFCCSTYFASCEPDTVLSSPNRLSNLFGSGRCAAAIPTSTSRPAPRPTPGPMPTPTPAPAPPPPAATCGTLCFFKSHCDRYPETCGGCSFCDGAPAPTPAPAPRPPSPSPTPSDCNSFCSKKSDCISYPSICGGCTFC